jgi:hypothetical protein
LFCEEIFSDSISGGPVVDARNAIMGFQAGNYDLYVDETNPNVTLMNAKYYVDMMYASGSGYKILYSGADENYMNLRAVQVPKTEEMGQ